MTAGMNAPMAMRIVAGTRLWMRPVDERAQRHPGSDATRFTTIATGRDEQVEQELVAGLVRIERVRQDALLGHEHVRAEDRPQDQGEGAR